MQLSDLIAMAAPVDVHPERCIRAFSPRATCSKCVQLCPNGSIRIDGGVVSVDTCDGCGRCIQACPHDVFEMDFPAALKMPQDGPLIICCRRHDFSDMPVLAANCLQQFTWLELAILVERFGEVVLFADQATCADCDFDWFPEGQQMLLERYGLAAYAEKLRVIRESDEMEAYLKAHFGDLNTRRAYMKNQLGHVRQAAEKYTRQSLSGYLDAFRETVHPERALVFEKTQSQALLLHELYEDAPERDPAQEIPLQALTNTHCRFCHSCEKLCPWQAIAIVEEEGRAVLAHHDVLCARCGLCLDICPEHGLHWDRGLTVENITSPHWRVLAEGAARECERCGEIFYTTEEGQTRCAVCRNKY